MYYSFQKNFLSSGASYYMQSYHPQKRTSKMYFLCYYGVAIRHGAQQVYKEYTLIQQVRNRCVKQLWLAVQRNLSSIYCKLLCNSVLFVQESILCSLCWDAAQARESGAAGQSLPQGLCNPMGTRMVQPINLSEEVSISEQS